ncbi:hypothetical protein ACFQ4U_10460 [Micrococcus antarcticus]
MPRKIPTSDSSAPQEGKLLAALRWQTARGMLILPSNGSATEFGVRILRTDLSEIIADYQEALSNGTGAQELLTFITGGSTEERSALLQAHGKLAKEAGWKSITSTGGPKALLKLTAALADPGPVVLLLDELQPHGLEAVRFIAALVHHEVREDRQISFIISGEDGLITPLLTEGAATFLQRAHFIDLDQR